jgi:phage-related protein
VASATALFPRQCGVKLARPPLYAVQLGDTDPAAKPMKGLSGASVLEIVSQYYGDTWRAFYTIRFRDAVTYSTRFRKNQSGDCRAKTRDRSNQTPPTAGPPQISRSHCARPN